MHYVGIAADESKRIERHKDKPDVVMPLVDIGWSEADCRQWCEENDLLSPVYEKGTRDGCWFCHNQGIGQLRRLRREHPDLWALLLKWDNDSPVSFHPDGRTVHDFDRRFAIEDEGYASLEAGWKWKYLEEIQLSLFDKKGD